MRQLQEGIQLTVIPTTKFKTIRIFIRFSTIHTRLQAVRRTLLTSVLETNSQKYPLQTDLSAKLAELYGASFGMNVSKKGNLHQVNVTLNLVNGKYINDDQILSEGIDFLKEVLFHPNQKAGLFDEETFRLEKENLLDYIASVPEDKQAFASLQLQELYFGKDNAQGIPSFGKISDLKATTNADLMATYQKMLAEDVVDIFVVGDVDETIVYDLFAQWDFPKNSRKQPEMFYTQALSPEVKERTVKEAVTQAKLNLAYHTDIYYTDEKRYALMVFNGLFGGFPHSKLFMNVREKNSLAYYASSSVDTFRGYLTVQTGIEMSNQQKVLDLIQEQLTSLAQGDFTDLAFEQTKAMLKNQILLSLDNSQVLIEMKYLHQWLPTTALDTQAYIDKLMQVSREEVQEIAKQIHLQAVFFLAAEGDMNE